MLGIVYATEAAASDALAAIDRARGYPRTYPRADVESGLVRLGSGVRIEDVRTDRYAEPIVLRDGTAAFVAVADEIAAARAAATPADLLKIPLLATARTVTATELPAVEGKAR
jgi:hypothetical protein